MITRQHINKLITINIIEIICVLSFVIIIIPILINKKDSYELSLLNDPDSISYINLEADNIVNYMMYPMSDEYALNNLYPTKLIVDNITLTSENYILTLKISKNSMMNYNDLKIAINDQIYDLQKLLIKENSDNYYFKVDNNSLKGNDKEYFIKVWLKENASSEEYGKKLDLSFELAKSVSRL